MFMLMFIMFIICGKIYFYFHDVLGACLEIRNEPYRGSLGPTLTVGPNIRLHIINDNDINTRIRSSDSLDIKGCICHFAKLNNNLI